MNPHSRGDAQGWESSHSGPGRGQVLAGGDGLEGRSLLPRHGERELGTVAADRPQLDPCTCWPAGGPPCPTHGTIRLNPHHEHGHYYGNDNWDASCCICDDNPCSVVTVEAMRVHRWYDIDRERLRSTKVGEDAPF